MNDQLLDIDVRLLVLRHGRQKVLSALASLVEQTPAQLEEQLQLLAQKSPTGRKKGPKLSLVELAASEFGGRDEISGALRALALDFENRLFLPNLRDVQRFLLRSGDSPQKLKSRAAAGPVVIRALSKLKADQLTALASRDVRGGESDYAMLSRAIMGGTSSGGKQGE